MVCPLVSFIFFICLIYCIVAAIVKAGKQRQQGQQAGRSILPKNQQINTASLIQSIDSLRKELAQAKSQALSERQTFETYKKANELLIEQLRETIRKQQEQINKKP